LLDSVIHSRRRGLRIVKTKKQERTVGCMKYISVEYLFFLFFLVSAFLVGIIRDNFLCHRPCESRECVVEVMVVVVVVGRGNARDLTISEFRAVCLMGY